MNRLLTLLLLAFLTAAASGQNPDIKRTWNWYFGNKAGLDFSGGNPVVVTDGAMIAEEGCAAISDTSGNLLFYTDGDTVWNRQHLPMPNGTGLMGCWSSTQSSLIVPKPQNDSLFYIFTTDCGENNGANGMRYSIVNMGLNGGLGDVVVKNQLLFAPSTEKLAAVHHSDGCGVWVAGLKRNPSTYTNEFNTFLVDDVDINTIPVLSSPMNFSGFIGDAYLKFSPNGQRVATYFSGTDTLVLFDFDNNTGVISNPIYIPTNSIWEAYGICFSPNSSVLYTSGVSFFPIPSQVYQYDLSSGTQSGIVASKTLIHSSTNMFPCIQIGPDAKLYISKANLGTGNADTLSIIHNPNQLGLACNFQLNGLFLAGRSCFAGLPNYAESYFDTILSNPCINWISEITNNKYFSIYPNPATDFFYIESTTSSEYFDLTVYDIFGRQIHVEKKIKTFKTMIDISTLNNGTLFIELIIGNNKFQYKLFKI